MVDTLPLAVLNVDLWGKSFQFGYWEIFGGLGQAMFASRFLVQWIISERRRQSVIPVAFWYLSLVGSLILLVYGIHREEAIFALGFLFNAFVYVRNLILIRRQGQLLRVPAGR